MTTRRQYRPFTAIRRPAVLLAWLLVLGVLLVPMLARAAPPPSSSDTSQAAPGWYCDESSALRWKGEVRGNRVRVAGGERTGYIAMIAYDRGVFDVWFQDAGHVSMTTAGVPGFEYHGGDQSTLQVLDYDAVIHQTANPQRVRLKFALLHYRGNFPGTETNDPVRDEYIFDTGCEYQE
jgi:hypothetical protein